MRRYRGGRLVREYRFAFRRKSLLRSMSAGWNELGYMFDGSSMMFSDVQSLRRNEHRKMRWRGEDEPMRDMVLVHELYALSQISGILGHPMLKKRKTHLAYL